jgi:hypothetical protein
VLRQGGGLKSEAEEDVYVSTTEVSYPQSNSKKKQVKDYYNNIFEISN